MPTKLITRSIQFHPEIWKILQKNADERDESISSFIRKIIEKKVKQDLISYAMNTYYNAAKKVEKERTGNELLPEDSMKWLEEIGENLKKMNAIELAKLFNKYINGEINGFELSNNLTPFSEDLDE